MLIEFQQAFADLVASPELCMSVRANSEVLRERYQLSELEHRQLIGIVKQRGMECNCMIYRANRLAPLAMNLPALIKALADDLAVTLTRYCAAYPNSDSHFLLESRRFCQFVEQQLSTGVTFVNDLRPALETESGLVAARVEASYTERYSDFASVKS